jgi:peptidyl-prolyl cis-trans isomerase SurA
MAQEKQYDSSVDSVDRTKWLWITILVAFALMIGGIVAFGRPETVTSQVRARHILIQANFNDPVSRADALDLIEDLRERIVEGGEDFGEIARNYSNDPTSSFRGGELPPASQGTYEEAFDEYAWSAKIGEVSPPVQTSYGFHLIEVLDRNYSKSDLAEMRVKERAMEELRQETGTPAEE